MNRYHPNKFNLKKEKNNYMCQDRYLERYLEVKLVIGKVVLKLSRCCQAALQSCCLNSNSCHQHMKSYFSTCLSNTEKNIFNFSSVLLLF